MEKTKKIKTAKVQTEISCVLVCPHCGIEFEINGTFTLFSASEWLVVPEVMTCRTCGAQVARPRSPFRNR